MSKAVCALALLVILSGSDPASQERPFPIFEGLYAGQTPPGVVPQRFAPGFVSTAGYDLTPAFSPGFDEPFFGRRPTEDICWVDTRVIGTALLDGQTPVPAPDLTGRTSIHDAATRGDLQAVKAAIAADPTLVDAEKPPNKKTALHYAAQNGHAEVVAFLLDKGAEVNRPNIAGETPLHYAVGLDNPAVVHLLLARGANPNARTTDGRTPLRMATAFGQLASIKALLDKGADARDTLPNGQTLLHVTAWVGPPEAIALFVSRGIDVNAAAKNGQTPLLIACAAGNATMAAALLDRGADPHARDASGRRPLEAAVGTGQPGMVKRLLEAGARPADVGTTDKRSALHLAAARGWLDITTMLLAAGADRAARDSQGRTPLELAVRYGNRRVADALGGASATAPASSPAKPALLAPAPKIGEAVVWYLGHMGWAVRTANHFMVFDYDGRRVPPDEPSLANGSIDPAEIRNLSTTVFITHGHPDHYAPGVFDWKTTVKNITYVTGFRPEGKEGYVFMEPRETKALGGLDITTTMANDEGVGFFVKVDGVTIFHSGDHASWTGGEENFRPEIDFLTGRGLRADLLFMPVSPTNDPAMNQGVHYAMTKLSAAAVFPGHVGGREDVAREFARDAAKAGMTAPIYCPEFGGDHFAVAGRRRGQLEQALATEAQRDRTRRIDKALDSKTVPFDTIFVLTRPTEEQSPRGALGPVPASAAATMTMGMAQPFAARPWYLDTTISTTPTSSSAKALVPRSTSA